MHQYFKSKIEYAYHLTQKGKFFKKARALIVKDDKLLLLKAQYHNGQFNYFFPGGGVDEGEKPKQTAAREALEEYGVVVNPTKYLGCSYYKVPLNHNGIDFISNRVEYFYACEYISQLENAEFGLEGEFSYDDRTVSKVALTLDEIKALPAVKLGNIPEKTYQKLVSYLETVIEATKCSKK